MKVDYTHMLAMVLAAKDGVAIQRQRQEWGTPGHYIWTDCDNPVFDFGTYNYRIKPEPRKPREWLVAIDPGRLLICEERKPPWVAETILVREVLPESDT